MVVHAQWWKLVVCVYGVVGLMCIVGVCVTNPRDMSCGYIVIYTFTTLLSTYDKYTVP